MNLAALPAHADFLGELARNWLAQGFAAGEGLILLPTRRAARELADAFLRVSDGRPMLLPRITALGAIDEAPLTLAGALDLPPAIGEMRRLALMASLIQRASGLLPGVSRADQAWALARELARLMDEAERAEITDLRAALRDLADGALAQHWAITLEFLTIITSAWPEILAEQGLMNPQARAVALLHAQARAWQEQPPDHPVWVAGATGGIAPVARLLKVVAGLKQGLVILPGLAEAWPEGMREQHPQWGLSQLLVDMGATLEDVTRWQAAEMAPAARTALIDLALLPAGALARWRDAAPVPDAGLSLLEPDDPQEEALAIALILRDALETPNARAALVTPDRQLALRVSAELLRFGVVADDSAGEKLAHAPPAVFLRLLAAAIEAELAPVALLALLKHPLAAAGTSPAECRTLARLLELAALRGPAPTPWLTGLREKVIGRPAQLAGFLDRIEAALAPMLRLWATADQAAPAEMLAALIKAAEALATTDDNAGPARLWAQEEGEALAQLMAEAIGELDALAPQDRSVLPGLLDALLEGSAVRGRRALRGLTQGQVHPRVFIWGLLEARLQTVDVMVLGSLVEGVWPPSADPGPWLSREMRRKAGLPSPELMVGQSAHDFATLAASAPQVILSSPRRRDGAPAVPARWLVRLQALLGRNARLSAHPAVHWARLLDQPGVPPRPARPPRPRPPVATRPRKLSVTEVETWLSDPYTLYARHILGLQELDPLEQGTDAADYGNLVHKGMARFLAGIGTTLPDTLETRLREALETELADARLRPALAAWWRPRLAHIARWTAEIERGRRLGGGMLAVRAEQKGSLSLTVPGGFTLIGRADRIESRGDGTLAVIDYKTGVAPTKAQVKSGHRPQLTLEAAMLLKGGFAGSWDGIVGELAYWKFGGAGKAGEEIHPFKTAAEITEAAEAAIDRLAQRVIDFDREETAYLARPHPELAARDNGYALLARAAEWSREEEDDASDPGSEEEEA